MQTMFVLLSDQSRLIETNMLFHYVLTDSNSTQNYICFFLFNFPQILRIFLAMKTCYFFPPVASVFKQHKLTAQI